MSHFFKRHFRLKRWFNCIRFAISDRSFKASEYTAVAAKPRLLLVKTEAIGDYVLFRNFLIYIRESESYKNHEITLVGNEIWKSLCLELDGALLDRTVFINRQAFQTQSKYRKDILQELGKVPYDEAVNCTFSREFLLGDSILKAVYAKRKTGMYGDDASEIPFVHTLSNAIYHSLLMAGSEEVFEFNRNKKFFETWLNTSIPLMAPQIFFQGLVPEDYAVILPGAQDKSRQWPAEKFKELAQYLHTQKGLKILVCGAASDAEAASEMIDAQTSAFIENACGKIALSELPKTLAKARIAICNDSGTLHLAAAVNTPCIGISNGNHYGRFTPYPAEANKKMEMMYPKSFLRKYESEQERFYALRFGSIFKINEIETSEVIQAAERILHD